MNAVVGHNIVAYRQGAILQNLKERYAPPLSFFMAAPFAGLVPGSAAVARLPFAICGLLTVMLILRWLHKDQAPWHIWVLTALAVLGNVSFFLYFRQCRYYGAAILISVATAYYYLHHDGRTLRLLVVGVLLAALLATHYVACFAALASLTVDYALWGRRRCPIKWRQWLLVALPPLLCAALIVPIWNPLRVDPFRDPRIGPSDHWVLLWWFFRDLNACEYVVGSLFLAAPLVYLLNRNIWLLRATLALVVYTASAALIVPQNIHLGPFAEVRHVAPAIALGIAVGVLVLGSLRGRWVWAGLALGVVAFGTNLFHGGRWLPSGLRATSWQFACELISPLPDPYRATSEWINRNIPANQTIYGLPDYAIYPLMFHSPQAIYAWQLSYPPEPQFKNLPAIHFRGLVPPDTIIAFGPDARKFLAEREVFPAGAQYRLVHTLDVFWRDTYRPELCWHSFTPVPCDLRKDEGIYILQRSGAGPPAYHSP